MRAVLALVLLAASPAAAQRFDSNSPIDVDAGRIDIADDANEAIFSGAVIIRQGSLTLNADRVRITYAKDGAGNPQVQRLDALGNVRLRQDTMRATANWFGPISTASVLRLFFTASLPKTAARSFCDASAPVAPGAGMRCTAIS